MSLILPAIAAGLIGISPAPPLAFPKPAIIRAAPYLGILPGFPVIRSGVPKIITFVGWSVNAFGGASVTLPAGIAAGDMMILFNYALSVSTNTPPTSVTPAGCTLFGTNQTSTAGTDAIRFNKWYKILDGSETTLTGMNAGIDGYAVWVFRKLLGTWQTPSISAEYCNSSVAAGSSQTIDSGAAPRAGFSGCFDNAEGGGSPGMTPVEMGSFSGGAAGGCYLIQNGSAPAITCAPVPGRNLAFASGFVGVTV